MARPAKQRRAAGQLRIIGGRWRGRKLAFTPREGLRPTPDRVRETLFNWLAPIIHGARCADLFAGSGALGLEALSRGADHCDFVDSDRQSIADIRRHLGVLAAADSARCAVASAEQFLADAQPYDIVFLDPPFKRALAAPVLQALEAGSLVRPGGAVYLETAVSEEPPPTPAGWRLHREKMAGGVAYRLFRLDASD